MNAADLQVDPEIETQHRASGWWNDDTILTYLERHASSMPDSPALISDNESLSWSELLSSSRAIAKGFTKAGIRRGDVVAVQLPNSFEFAQSLFACAMVGAVFQPVHLPYRGNDLKFLLQHSNARAFVGLSGDSDYSAIRSVAALGGPELCIGVGGEIEGEVSWVDLSAECENHCELTPLAAVDPYLLLYTSGTTSSPKGVPHASTTMLSGVRSCSDELRFSSEDRFLILSYYSHMWGITAFTIALYAGAATIMTPKFTPAIFGSALANHDPTVVIGAPVHILKADEAGVFEASSASSLKYLITSGSAFPGGSLTRVTDKLKPARILELWGMTEVAPICITRPESSVEAAMGTVGPCLPHSEVRVIASDGSELPPDTAGELQINASSVFFGYLNNPEANASSFDKDGWFSTGDIASIDEIGVVRIQGRTKEVINRGGVKFSVTDTEKIINRHQAVSICSVVPVPDSIMGEKACCVVHLRANETLDLPALCEYLMEQGVEKMKWPEYVVTVDSIPMTPTGKPQREKITTIAAAATKEAD